MSVSALRRSGTVLVGTVLLVMVPASLGGAEQATTRDIQALLERAENATQAGHYDQAEEAYKRFLEIQPDVPTVLNNLGSVFLRTGRYHGAVEYFKRARNLDGNLFQVRLNLAICLYRLEPVLRGARRSSSCISERIHRTIRPTIWRVSFLFPSTTSPSQ